MKCVYNQIVKVHSLLCFLGILLLSITYFLLALLDHLDLPDPEALLDPLAPLVMKIALF